MNIVEVTEKIHESKSEIKPLKEIRYKLGRDLCFNCWHKNSEDDSAYYLELPSRHFVDHVIATEFRYLEDFKVFAIYYFKLKFLQLDEVVVGKDYVADYEYLGGYFVAADGSYTCHWIDASKFSDNVSFKGNYFKFPALNENDFAKFFQRLVPVFYMGANTYHIPDNYADFFEWLKNPNKKPSVAKVSKECEDILNVKLPKITKSMLSFMNDDNYSTCWWKERRVLVITPVKDDIVCLRFVYFSRAIDSFYETSRFYIGKDIKLPCLMDASGNFVATSYAKFANLKPKQFVAQAVIIDENLKIENTVLSNYADILDLRNDNRLLDVSLILFNALINPIDSVLYRGGLLNALIEYHCGNTRYDSWEKFAETHFGSFDKTATTATEMLHINDFQLNFIAKKQVYEKYSRVLNSRCFLRELKEALGDDISAYPDDVITNFVQANEKSCVSIEAFAYALKTFRNTFQKKATIEEINNFLKACIKNGADYYLAYREYLRLLVDGASEAKAPMCFKTLKELKLYIEKISENDRKHFNAVKYDSFNEVYNERLKMLKNLEYKKGDFEILTYSSLESAIRDFDTLDLGYWKYQTDTPETLKNFLAIRRVNESDYSFFVVEIDNGLNVVKAFGYSDAKPTERLINFLRDWATEKHLNFNLD